MPNPPVLLAALMAPGSVESEVGALQAALFLEHGLASAQALPPLIPIAFLDPAGVDRRFLPDANAAVSRGWRICLKGMVWVEGHLYAAVESGGVWKALRSLALERCGSATEALFPVAEGFYLGCADAPPELKPLIRPQVPDRSFSSCSIGILAVSAERSGTEWWMDVSWEVREECPLRGRKEN
jgi:hypothetical protein